MNIDLLKVDFSNYESPIQKIVADMQTKMIEQEKLEQTKWIPCSEKSPDKNERLALLYDNGLVSGGKYLGDRTYDVDFPDQNKKTRVVAWMPIPPSYEPQESEDKV